MSTQQHGGYPTPSAIAAGFGYVTPEDRAKWEQARAQGAPRQRSAVAEFVQSSVSAAGELAREGIQARLRAAHQVAAEEERDDTRTRVRRRTIVETENVNWVDRDDRRHINGPDQSWDLG